MRWTLKSVFATVAVVGAQLAYSYILDSFIRVRGRDLHVQTSSMTVTLPTGSKRALSVSALVPSTVWTRVSDCQNQQR